MSTSKDNSRKLPQNCVYQKESDKKGNKKHQPSLYFFHISFPWDPSIASLSINQQTVFIQRSPRQSMRGAHCLHCQDATKPHLQSCQGRVMQNSFRSWTWKKQGKQWSDTHHGGWHFMYRSDDMHGSKKILKACNGLLGQKVQKAVVEVHCCSRKSNHCLWEKSIFLDSNSSAKGIYNPAHLWRSYLRSCVRVFTRLDSNCAT